MTAYTVTPTGDVIRWHLDRNGLVGGECRGPTSGECERQHASMADLAFCTLIGEMPSEVAS